MMDLFETKKNNLFLEIGSNKNMVLSTSCNDKVTSRMMSIIIFDGAFYFQTDKTFRKYDQIIRNYNVSLCFDNISIEGVCTELGKPADHQTFIEMYKKHYGWSFQKYSLLENERLFMVEPVYIQRWIYENSEPYIESFDFENEVYSKVLYNCESSEALNSNEK